MFYSGQLTLLLAVLFASSVAIDGLNLTVIHNNDFHTRFFPIKSKNYAECELNSNITDCIGGAARTVAKMKQLRAIAQNNRGNILFLNAGDHFQGTFWYTILKSQVVAEFVSLMKHDVMAIGNHEFDDGPAELTKFIDKVKTDPNLSILSCNIDVDSSSMLAGKIQKSTMRSISGIPVAIIGYTTPDTKFLSKPGNMVTFRDEIVAIKEEIAQLKTKFPTLNIFIAVGHSGYERDLQIGKAIADLDLIVGGHTNTFLFSGPNVPSNEKPEGEYPTVIKHSSGEQTLVVQAFAYGKYLGKLDLVFNEDGRVTHYEGQPIYLDAKFDQDAETKQLIDDLNAKLGADLVRTIGFTDVDLEGPEQCRREECNIGNLIADAFAGYFDMRLRSENAFVSECNTTLSLINGGNIRSSISRGNITYKSVISTLPFNNQQGLLKATGSELLELFHHSAKQYRQGGFMQVSSGLRVQYNMNSEQQLELKTLQVRCQNSWQNMVPNVTYLVALNDFIAKGGDNYTMINPENWTDYTISDSESFTKYIENVNNATAFVEGRVQILGKSSAATRILQINLVVVIFIHFVWNKRYTNG